MRAVFFDWDGTLADTAEATYRTYERVFGDFGIAFDREVYRRTYSPDWYHTFHCLGIPRERWPEADERWLAHFAEETYELIEGVHELLAALTARGMRTGIVTTSTTSSAATTPSAASRIPIRCNSASPASASPRTTPPTSVTRRKTSSWPKPPASSR